MLKNRPIMMLVTGIFLALVLWGLVLLSQRGKPKIPNPTPPPKVTAPANGSAPITQDISITPASVLMVTQDGRTFSLSGYGTKGAGLFLMNGEHVLSTANINKSGEWVLGFSDENQQSKLVLTLLMVTPEGYKVWSDQSLIIVQNPQAPNGPADENTSIDGEIRDKALILLTAPGAHSRVMQTPYQDLPGQEGFLLEAIDYDNSGGVIFSGRSLRQGKVRVYANNNPVGESRVDSTGRWSLIFGNIMPLGKYNIAFELVSDSGVNSTQFELPFSRIKPIENSGERPQIIVENLEDRIQLGRPLYGGGYQYTVVYSPIAMVE